MEEHHAGIALEETEEQMHHGWGLRDIIEMGSNISSQLRCLAPQAGQEDRNLTARPLLMHILRQGLCQA